jgi:succinate dehydrogenase hydrophobic anchor subunit
LKKNLDFLRVILDLYLFFELIGFSILIYFIVSKKGGVHGSMHEWFNISFNFYLSLLIFSIVLCLFGIGFGIKDYSIDFFKRKNLFIKIFCVLVLIGIEISLEHSAGKV